jgi:hypothetical protein
MISSAHALKKDFVLMKISRAKHIATSTGCLREV